MTQTQLVRAVARATRESPDIVRRLGFSVAHRRHPEGGEPMRRLTMHYGRRERKRGPETTTRDAR